MWKGSWENSNPIKSEVSAILSASASAIAIWLNDRGLILNASKSQVISTSRNLPEKHSPLLVNFNGTLLPLVKSSRYPRVIFDSNMSWDDHVTRCANRVSQNIGVLWRMPRCLSTQGRINYFRSIIMPDLLYGQDQKCMFDISSSQALSSTPGSAKPWFPYSVRMPAMNIRT